ncbi:hypothetical protein OD350_22305 [Clostridium beijerinckii]|uniref:hypothetical protein n=1 Tax=Clostridium beijerinckii TaxID=1520 RepID=UPI002226B5D0|nr:hypothetical protein [Clostridium beijerinckii]UYZ34954.1 hypothetical protein OD350_22305 [Clostridium beijerinckii]
MQLTIKDTHIFDRKIQTEFREFIKLQKDKLNTGKSYELNIIYNAKAVLDKYEDKFYFDNSIYNNIKIKFKNQNKKDEAISRQLEQCRGILKDYGIECYNSRIEGDNLKDNNVKIVIKEDKSEPFYMGRGKNKGRISVTMIVPNREYTINKMGELYNKSMNEIYFKLNECISNNIMCKILDIQYTEDENIIYKAFCKEYGDLWLCTENEGKKLKEKLLNRVMMLIELEQKDKEMLDNNDIPKGSINNI